MKKQTGIWIDTSKAIIVSLDDGKEKITEIESDIENRVYHDKEGDKGSFMGSQHISNEKTFDERKKSQLNHFLKDVMAHVKETDEIYVFGPADTKTKLSQKMHEENTFDDRKLKSVETSDSMTPNQIVAKVKHFYGHN